jgi:hypothetical protein
MGAQILLPTSTTRVSAGGYTFEIITVTHTYHASNDSAVEVDASAIDARHLPTAGQTYVAVSLDTSTDSTLWTKTITLTDTSASGEYTFVVRHAGEAGGFKGDL